jgi:hypothetical protein
LDGYVVTQLLYVAEELGGSPARGILLQAILNRTPLPATLVDRADTVATARELLGDRAKDLPFAIRMDLHMLVLLGARERTGAEFRALLASAGLTVTRIVATGSPAGLSVIEARAT